jgi:uncharacterized Fe-S cluster-containing radical SAM superfamily protein
MSAISRLDPKKFKDPQKTASGEKRAFVEPRQLKILWVNTGTLCNIACSNCYIESSPRNDRLSYLKASELRQFLEEIRRDSWGTEEIGFTGGEPFMNPEMIPMLEDVLSRGFRALVLTNAMKPMLNKQDALKALSQWFGNTLTLRVSIDHYHSEKHETERGTGTWQPMLEGIKFLTANGISFDIAGRKKWDEDELELRDGYAALFKKYSIDVDAYDPIHLTLFPEMDSLADVPEITTSCWDILGIDQSDLMCSNSRMLIKRTGERKPSLVSCTLLPYEPEFELGKTIEEAWKPVALNHPHCAKFCVLGGGACSAN